MRPLEQPEPPLNLGLDQLILGHLRVVLVVAVDHAFRPGLDVDLVAGWDLLEVTAQCLLLRVHGHVEKVDPMREGGGEHLLSLIPAEPIEDVAGPSSQTPILVEPSRPPVG